MKQFDQSGPQGEPLDSRRLDAGLRAVFGGSVLSTIESVSGRVPRVLLRPTAELDTPLLKPHGRETESVSPRYQMVGELARGGVGVILKARDVDLGRDVAVKMLKAEHMSNAGLLQRFVEEAQIGGQLQHPGIVPVYEIGVQNDQRPYFTMKLVKGKTLAALLADRADPSSDLAQLLSTFRQVCQTLAYAHARGVVHRDVKPANVMVGAFGDVQVVDWGFAKVLTSGGIADERRSRDTDAVSVIATVRSESDGSASLAGSIMGTPAYMPPEQALGRVEELDERSDVFCLGAILCELLTGEPPYVRRNGELIEQAARADLADAWRRLERCGAEDSLVALARRCLDVQQSRRPKDAGAVAQAVDDHLSAVETRARDAQLRAATHRMQLRWGAAVALLLLVTAAGAWWADQGRRSRVAQASSVARDAIEQAMMLRGQASSESPESLEGWSAANAAASGALELASFADALTRDRARQLVVDIERDEAEARRAAFAAAEERALVARLTELRTRRGSGFDAAETADGFAQAFAVFESEPDRIRASGIREELVGALDDWGGAPELASSVDPDPWREVVRNADGGPEGRALLVELARPNELEGLPLASLVLLGERLGRVGELERAVEVLRTARARFPESFWASFGLAWWCRQATEAGVRSESAEHMAAALALRSDALVLRQHLSATLEERHDLERALSVMAELVARAPDYPGAREQLGALYGKKGDLWFDRKEYSSAVRAYRRAVELLPRAHELLSGLSRALWEVGSEEEALARSNEVIEVGGETLSSLQWRAYLLANGPGEHGAAIDDLRRGIELAGEMGERVDASAYRQLGESLEAIGALDAALDSYHAATSAGTSTWGARGDYDAVVRVLEARDGPQAAAEYLLELAEELPSTDWLHHLLAGVLVRSGRLGEAVVHYERQRGLLREDVARDPHNGFLTLRLAFSYANVELHELRDVPLARRLLDEGLARRPGGVSNPSAHDRMWFVAPILYRAAEYDAALAALQDIGARAESLFALAYLTLIHAALGNETEARIAWQGALEAASRERVGATVREAMAEARQVMGGR